MSSTSLRTSPPSPLPSPGLPPTFRPWTHTSDDSYIYQLSLVVATATVSLTLHQGLCVARPLNTVQRVQLGAPDVSENHPSRTRMPSECSISRGCASHQSELKTNCPCGHEKKKNQKSTSQIVLKQPKTRLEKEGKKKEVPLRVDFCFRRIPKLFFSCPPRQSLPLGRFRGGRATQKVGQTKTGARAGP